MAKIIVPVGYPVGAVHPFEGSDDELRFDVIVGKDQSVDVVDEQYALWRLMFSDLDAHRELRFTYDHLVETAEANGLENPAPVIDMFLKSGLAAQYETDHKSSIEFLKRYRLEPQGEGVGSTAEDPSTFRVMVGDVVAITLFHDLYVLWSGAGSWPNMWEIVRSYSKHRKGVPLNTDELGMLFAATIPSILSARAGYVVEAT